MRTYFFGDVHGNLQALEACLRHMESLKVDAVFCLGDIAGWLPFGDRTFAKLRAAGFPTVAGNHDLLIAGSFTDHPDQRDRMQATAYNAGLLFPVPGAIDYLLALPLSIETGDFTVVHHCPFNLPPAGGAPTIESFGYLDDAALARFIPAWRKSAGRLIFSGHDHVPAIFELPEGGDVLVHRPGRNEASTSVGLKQNSRYWIKAGSVGGPYRDGVPMANSVLYDSDAQAVTLFRIAYDTGPLHEELSAHRFCRNLPTIKKYIELLRAGAKQE